MGSDLALARVRLGASIEDISGALRIRPEYIRALEEGRPERLPGSAYALAFLRSYAAALGLDANEVVRRYKRECASLQELPELEFPQPPPSRVVPLGAAALIAAMLAVGAYAGWYRLSDEGRLPAEVVPPVPQHLADLAARPASQRTAAAEPLAPAPRPLQLTQAGAMHASPVGSVLAPLSVSPTQAAAAVLPAAVTPQPAPAPVPTPALPAPEAVRAEPVAASAAPGFFIRAIADSWVQVRDGQGHVVFSRLMRAGDSWPVPDRPDLVMTTGNAGGTEFVDDGIATGPLGGQGVVRHDLPLDPEQVKAGRLGPVASIAAPR